MVNDLNLVTSFFLLLQAVINSIFERIYAVSLANGAAAAAITAAGNEST